MTPRSWSCTRGPLQSRRCLFLSIVAAFDRGKALAIPRQHSPSQPCILCCCVQVQQSPDPRTSERFDESLSAWESGAGPKDCSGFSRKQHDTRTASSTLIFHSSCCQAQASIDANAIFAILVVVAVVVGSCGDSCRHIRNMNRPPLNPRPRMAKSLALSLPPLLLGSRSRRERLERAYRDFATSGSGQCGSHGAHVCTHVRMCEYLNVCIQTACCSLSARRFSEAFHTHHIYGLHQ